MSKVEVLVGLPGSGKSSRLSFVNDPEFSDTVFVYSTDNYIESVASAQGKTYNGVFRDVIGEATENMNNFLQYALEDKVDIYWDQTNMSSKKRKSILSKFPKNYRKECWCVAPPRTPEEWVELDRRLASRVSKTIPHHIVEAMADSYVEPELDEGFDKITIVDLFGNVITVKGH
jgi:tRNA uridine 5-carbamoylmethylation protein Kti12